MRLKILALLLFGLSIPAVCSAQSLKSGTWTGTVSPPDGQMVSVTLDVTVKGDSLGIVIHAGEHGDFTAFNAAHANGTITFAFEPGIRVTCTLPKNEEGDFAGNCLGEDGSVAQMKMVPPKD